MVDVRFNATDVSLGRSFFYCDGLGLSGYHEVIALGVFCGEARGVPRFPSVSEPDIRGVVMIYVPQATYQTQCSHSLFFGSEKGLRHGEQNVFYVFGTFGFGKSSTMSSYPNVSA